MSNKTNSKTINHRFILPSDFQQHLNTFIKDLSEKGYTEFSVNAYYGSISHFCEWLHRNNIALSNVSDKVLASFSRHRCRCYSRRRNNRISVSYVRRVRRFIFYLYQKDIITKENPTSKISRLPVHLEKFKHSLQSRGLSAKTILQYERYISILLSLLGDNSKKYNAAHVRKVIVDATKKKSRCEVKKITTALRSYLRFLITEGVCCPDLDAAVPTVAEWKLSSMPKYLGIQDVERVIAACDDSKPQGARDRAIILLLSRLGLRAGDVIIMQTNDINWSKGTLRVCGKARREVLLPLPQEVGDAILHYLKYFRPKVALDELFLCLNAPYRAIRVSSNISSVVSAALDRADIKNPPSRGAHLLRHSAATHMLRQGATLETVSIVLRHQSLDMTSYYAKVDVMRLMQIAQPWPEGAPC